VFATIGWLAVVLAGFGILMIALEPKEVPHSLLIIIRGYFGTLLEPKTVVPFQFTFACWVIGVCLLFIAALSLASPLGRPRRSRLLEFPTESGKVQVDITALETCLAHVVGEEEGVIRARVSLRGGTGGKTPLGCTATIWFEAGPDIIGRVSEIQARMRAYYYQVLPIKEPVKIDIRTKLVYQKSSARAVETQQKADKVTPQGQEAREDITHLPAPREDYSGPQYPMEGEESPGEGDVKV
jgi:hypothetical protein